MTLRWVVRRGDAGKGTFIFINNYQRLVTLPPKEKVRLELHINGTTEPLAIPSQNSVPLTIPSGVWCVWPVDFRLLGETVLVYATAQLVARVRVSSTSEVLFLVASRDVAVEFAFKGGSALVAGPGKATLAHEGASTIFRNVSLGTAAFTVVKNGMETLSVVVLPSWMGDSAYIQMLGGVDRLLISGESGSANILISQHSTLYMRTDYDSSIRKTSTTTLWMCPAPAGGLEAADGEIVPSEEDGVFTKFSPFITKTTKLTNPIISKVKDAAPPRLVPKASSGKAQEPTIAEWLGAAVYHLTLPDATPAQGGDYRLSIDYVGDSARVYFGGRLLTDNWYSGYSGDGAMEVGLNYLAGENPGLLAAGASLELWILPLKKSDLLRDIYLQERLWPAFGEDDAVLVLNNVTVKGLVYTELAARAELTLTI